MRRTRSALRRPSREGRPGTDRRFTCRAVAGAEPCCQAVGAWQSGFAVYMGRPSLPVRFG
jgi:hypothetical protein